jgi:hypothetical protein
MNYAEDRARRRRLAALLTPSKQHAERPLSVVAAIFGTLAFLLTGLLVFIMLGAAVTQQNKPFAEFAERNCLTVAEVSAYWKKPMPRELERRIQNCHR